MVGAFGGFVSVVVFDYSLYWVDGAECGGGGGAGDVGCVDVVDGWHDLYLHGDCDDFGGFECPVFGVGSGDSRGGVAGLSVHDFRFADSGYGGFG